MRRAMNISVALLVSVGAALLLYYARSNFLSVQFAHTDRASPPVAVEHRDQEGAPALAGGPPAKPARSQEEKQ